MCEQSICIDKSINTAGTHANMNNDLGCSDNQIYHVIPSDYSEIWQKDG